MYRRQMLLAALAAGCASLTAMPAAAGDDPFRIGLILPMTGPFASTGREIDAAVRLYVAQHGETVAGRRIEVVLKDDGGVADATKRIAQELIVHDKVSVLAGFGLTPLALATAPLTVRAKVPMVVMAAATSAITEKSPYVTRTSYTTPQVASVIARWAAGSGIKTMVTLVSDYGPGLDSEASFTRSFEAAGGKMLGTLRVPLQNPDFAPFLQKLADLKPDGVYVFVPSGVGAPFMKQYIERGLDRSGIRLISEGGITDDEILDSEGDPALGAITGFHYSAAHDSALNRDFVTAFMAANPGMRPNFMAVGGYDGMALIYKALEKTGGAADGDALIGAMKGMSWESPRGPITIDPQTREIVQNVYMRKVERVDGALWNVEFETFEAVKDPGKAPS